MTEHLIRYLLSIGAIVLLIVLLIILKACSGRQPRFRPVMVPAFSLQGALFGNPAELPALVYLPPSYGKTDRRYPVVYYLPGFTTNIEEITAARERRGDLARAVNRLIRRGEIKEMIVVVASGRNFLGGGFYTNSPVTGDWEDFIVRDVVGYIDSNYRTIARPSSRGITGESMGGFGSFHLAMKHPDVFGAVYSISPGLVDERGIRNLDKFMSPDYAERYLGEQVELDRLPAGQAKARFIEYIDSLYATGDDFDYNLAAFYAYSAVFAPRPEGRPPHIGYPLSRSGEGLVPNLDVLRELESGYDDLAEKIDRYVGNLSRLKAIVIDYGVSDRYQWIPPGCEYLSRLLDRAGISHELRRHEGGHGDRLRERIETQMLPFFSEHLDREVTPPAR
jgi:S-formylglutathione hydrolase